MAKFKPLLLTLLVLASLATLFPPFHWGGERLQTEAERNSLIARGADIRVQDVLPAKKYAFLFGDSKQEFKFGVGWDQTQQQFNPITLTLSRRLIVSELILEYILAFFVALVIHVVVMKRSLW